MYKSLFIDLDDTLWAFSENARDSFQDAYDAFGLGCYFESFDHFYSVYTARNSELWVEYGKGQITKDELNRQRFLFPLQAVGVDDEALAKAYSDRFFELIPTKSKLMPYAKEALEYLASKYRLFVLSNGFRELQSRKMKSAGISDYFEKVILSEDILIHKPYPEIFYFALSATQSELKHSLMIGDSWDADIAGAQGVGMHQMFYNIGELNAFPFSPTYTLNSWKNIQNML